VTEERHNHIAPQCCEPMCAIKPIVMMMAEDYESAVWYLRIAHSSDDAEVVSERCRRGYEPAPSPTACPFCAKPLPEIVRRADPPQPMHVYSDGYCKTCGERAMCCECWAPWFAWEARG
jgi:hypothetical protein